MIWLLALMGLAAAGSMVMASGDDSEDDEPTEAMQPEDGVQRTDLSDIDPNLQGALIQGTDGNDLMAGGAGTDLMFGNDGNDLIGGGAGNDLLIDDEGSDSLMGDSGDDLLFGAGLLDVDAMQGMFDNPPVTITAIANTVAGSFDDGLADSDDDPDTLSGGDGDDTIFGGNGDMMIGGTGADLFVGGEYVQPDAPVTIADFVAGEDVLVYATEDGSAGDLSITFEGADGAEDAIVRDGGRHVMTVRGVGNGFTLDDITALNQL